MTPMAPGALLEDDTRLYDLESDPAQEKPLGRRICRGAHG